MKFFKIALVLAFVLVFAPFVSAQGITSRATPPGVDLVAYPLKADHAMTPAEMAELKLHPVLLTEDVVVYNFSHRIGGFFVDKMKKGEVAVATEKGELVYKASCTNRIAVIPPAPKAAVDPVKPIERIVPVVPPPVAGSEFWDMLWNIFKFLLFLLIMALLGWLVIEMIRRAYGAMTGGYGTYYPAPNVGPTTVSPATTPIVTPPVHPASITSIRRWGPFSSIHVSDRQRDGYHVMGDGRQLGTFSNPGRTEDAGTRGHWFIVEETTN